MELDLNELERLALAATPGPWIACGPSFGDPKPRYLNEVCVDREEDDDDGYSVCDAPRTMEKESSDDMAYIAAANPAVVLELIRRLRGDDLDAAIDAAMATQNHAATPCQGHAAQQEADDLVGLRGCNSRHGGMRALYPCIYRMRTTDPGCTGCVERDEDQHAEAGHEND